MLCALALSLSLNLQDIFFVLSALFRSGRTSRAVLLVLPFGIKCIQPVGLHMLRVSGRFNLIKCPAMEADTLRSAAGISGKQRWAIIFPSSARVSHVTYEAVVAVRYPELDSRDAGEITFGKYLAVENDGDWDHVDDENVASTSSEDDTKKLMYPYDKEEPQLTDEQMVEFDGIADEIEIQRLLSIGVLLNASCLDGTN